MKSETTSPGHDRKYRRIDIELRSDARILLPDMDPEWFSPKVTNLGRGGLAFDFPSSFPIGTELQMSLYNGADQIDLVGNVVWTITVSDFRDKVFKCGLMFTRTSEENMARIDRILNPLPSEPSTPTYH